MGGSYSIAIRERAVKFVEEENGSPKEACAVLGIHYSTLTKWLKKYRETGGIAPLCFCFLFTLGSPKDILSK